MPNRRIKTPEQLHEEELDRMATPAISYLVLVKRDSDDGSESSTESWSYISENSAISAFLRLTDNCLDQILVNGYPKPRKGNCELWQCDRGLIPTKLLARAEVMSPSHSEKKDP